MAGIKPMTKEELANLSNFPKVHKDAIEHAIWEGIDREDPEDKEWPNYFRAEVVECMLGCRIGEDDKLEVDEYVTEQVWWQSGWKARGKASQGKLV